MLVEKRSILNHLSQIVIFVYSFFFFQKLCEGIFKVLVRDIPTTCQVSCLEVLRILSRDKKILVPVTTKENMQILLRLAKLNESDDSLEKVSEFPVIVESLKCLCNIVFNSQMAQQLSLELNLAAKLCNLLRKCKDRKFINDIKCFDLRLLFLLSLLHTDIRSQLRYELQGLPLLTQILESAFSIKWTDEYESAIAHNGPPLSPQETDCAIEALKALFNVTVDSWKVHKEVRLRRVLSTVELNWSGPSPGAACKGGMLSWEMENISSSPINQLCDSSLIS